MKATKEQLKNNIGKEVFIIPRGNLVGRGDIRVLSSVIKSVGRIYVVLENSVGLSMYTDSFRLDEYYDNNNCGGYLFLSREAAENYLWRENFIKDFKYNIDMNKLTYEDCREIDNVLRKYE
jgi:hypothetical protein